MKRRWFRRPSAWAMIGAAIPTVYSGFLAYVQWQQGRPGWWIPLLVALGGGLSVTGYLAGRNLWSVVSQWRMIRRQMKAYRWVHASTAPPGSRGCPAGPWIGMGGVATVSRGDEPGNEGDRGVDAKTGMPMVYSFGRWLRAEPPPAEVPKAGFTDRSQGGRTGIRSAEDLALPTIEPWWIVMRLDAPGPVEAGQSGAQSYRRHTSEKSALNEARRLAKDTNGRFAVMVGVAVIAGMVEATVEDIPF